MIYPLSFFFSLHDDSPISDSQTSYLLFYLSLLALSLNLPTVVYQDSNEDNWPPSDRQREFLCLVLANDSQQGKQETKRKR